MRATERGLKGDAVRESLVHTVSLIAESCPRIVVQVCARYVTAKFPASLGRLVPGCI